MKCWAAPEGPCRDGQSGEHLVSEGLFQGKTAFVSGLHWLTEPLQEVPLTALRANILCRHHNSILSPVDSGGIAALELFREVERLQDLRASLKPKRVWDVVSWRLDGLLFERWCMKTVVNFVVALEKSTVWWTGAPHSTPPASLVLSIFGQEPVSPPFGLYFSLHPDRPLPEADGVGIKPIVADRTRIVGASFSFLSLELLIWLSPEPPSSYDGVIGAPGSFLSYPPLYRRSPLRFTVGSSTALSQRVHVDWQRTSAAV